MWKTWRARVQPLSGPVASAQFTAESCDMSGASFDGADVTDATFDDVVLVRATFEGA